MILTSQSCNETRPILLQSLNAAASAPPSPPLEPVDRENVHVDLSRFRSINVVEKKEAVSGFAKALFPDSPISKEIQQSLNVTVSKEGPSVEFIECQAFIWNDTIFMEPPAALSGPTTWADGEFQRCIISLIEMAENRSDCHRLVVAIHHPVNNGNLLRAFMYVGFTLVHPQTYHQKSDFMLFGYEI
ncbi:hypothetical protein INT44_006080 [Umbelopsis vinacea]|uniref:Ornithine decarboxylase antizyme n=1 Tax=Umbelopsis vinacea TaxID=44442 RepID=A0A8H7ULD2_9FUNG|nr:hypothetical protein INT44_006080 [Umbelopsis vinacea]KAI9282147.1 hypothetical protein BC943DRAFT_329281 [Umbelopsis sp. AD052]